jgi:hypothetical protein
VQARSRRALRRAGVQRHLRRGVALQQGQQVVDLRTSVGDTSVT